MRQTFSLVTATAAALLYATAAFAADDKIQKIVDNGTLRVCHAEAAPWGVKDPASGEWVGSDIRAAAHLAETMGVGIEHVDATWATLIPSLEADKCDIAMAPIFRSAERAMRVLFTEPTGYETMGVAVRGDSGIASYADLDQADKTVAVISGSADEAFASRFFKNAKIQALVTDKISTLGIEAASRRVDAFLTDTSTLRSVVGANEAMNLTIIEPDNPLNPQGYSYALPMGEYGFQQLVNIWQINTDQQGLKQKWHDEFAQ
ncbi:transporter substrate-binding domain-containing protein [Nitratireductor sp. CAU 1489]|uniref:Transporter substrate-binding domain-containing protein n=1 Tax=Nitratireductor arenosus TaxID=2682096 RepID=A0A844QC90_9HYPH|nr:transporter substrate-binding domain-containing protein [Nitratireductor arenosus]MVA96254.1 transporter substrate-binding domain-containing protein [Nitratireductor arenosus]